MQQPPISTLISKVSDRSEQGTVFGVYHGLGSLARAIGPLVAGAAYKFVRPTAPFVIAGTIMVIVAARLATLRRATATRQFEPTLTDPRGRGRRAGGAVALVMQNAPVSPGVNTRRVTSGSPGARQARDERAATATLARRVFTPG